MVSQEERIDAGLRALSDSTRRGILALLKQGQLSVLEIAERFPMSRPAISKHLRILKEAGLVLETPAGRQRLYALDLGPLKSLQLWLADLKGFGEPAQAQSSSGKARRSASSRQPAPRQLDWRVW